MTRLFGGFRHLSAWPYRLRGECSLRRAAREGNAEQVRQLLKEGIDPDARSWLAQLTALGLASRDGHESVVEVLLCARADFAHRTRRGAVALTLASQRGHLAIVQRLLSAGADVEAVLPRSGATALVVASISGHADVVRALLAAGADPEARTRNGGTTLGYATEPAIIELLCRAVRVRTASVVDTRQFADCITTACTREGRTNGSTAFGVSPA